MLADWVPAPPGAFFPSSMCTWWPDLLRPYQNTTNLLTCPSVRSGFGIAMNHPFVLLTRRLLLWAWIISTR